MKKLILLLIGRIVSLPITSCSSNENQQERYMIQEGSAYMLIISTKPMSNLRLIQEFINDSREGQYK